MLKDSVAKPSKVHKKIGKKAVVYNNDLNKLNIGMFSPGLQDVFVTIAACARDGDEIGGQIVGIENMLTHHVEISFDDFRKMTGLSMRGDGYVVEVMEKFGKDIASLQYQLILPTKIIGGSLFPLYEIDKETRTLKVAVSPSLSYILSDTDKNFTEFLVEDHCNLTGKASKTLYRILCQWKCQGYTQWYGIDELKTVFGCIDYDNKNFVRELRKAIKELTDKKAFRNLTMDFKKDRSQKGAPISDIQFKFSKTKYTPVLVAKKG